MIERIIVKLFGGLWKLKEKCMKSGNKFIISFYYYYLDTRGCFIGYNTKFKSIPILPHGYNGIFISNEAKIGKNCVIFHQVTIGSNTLVDSKGKGSPIIGDNCYIGAGAKIIGGIKIGNNVRIGANCTVFQDIPDNSVVVSNTPRVIQKEKMNNRYYSRGFDGWYYVEEGKRIKENDKEVLSMLS